MPNEIYTRQNTTENLRHFAASRVWYTQAKRMASLQGVLAVSVPLISAYVLAQVGDPARPWTTGAAITLSLIEVLLLEPAQRRWRVKGANEQEMFDCHVLDLPWPAGLAGSRPSDTDTIEAIAGITDAQIAKHQDWYRDVRKVAPQLGALICQRCNTWWDHKSRASWRFLLRAAAVAVVLIVLGVGIRGGYRMSDLILTVYAPLSPLILWFIKEEQKHHDASVLSKRGLDLVTAVWDGATGPQAAAADTTTGVRDVQDAIYMRRRNSPMVPGWLHNLQRKRFLAQMDQIVSGMLAQTTRSQAAPGT